MAVDFTPVLFALLGIILLVIIGFYLLIRRTAMAYREGSNRGRR